MERYIYIDGAPVAVSEEVYRAYKRPAWSERKRRQTRAEKERSLDAFADAGFDIPSGDALIDELVADKLLLETLTVALDKLPAAERELINALYYDEKTQCEVAREAGISQPAVHKRHNRILEKLKKLLS